MDENYIVVTSRKTYWLKVTVTKTVGFDKRKTFCKNCKGEIIQRWGQVKKKVKGIKIRRVKIYRYHCTSCKRTFRHYLEEIDRLLQSKRLKKLAVICWTMGLSYRGLGVVFYAFGVPLSRMSGWRDVQEEGETSKKKALWKSARNVGVDRAWLNGEGIMVAADLGDGEPLVIGKIDEKDIMLAVLNWLGALKQKHGIGARLTDDLGMYRGITEKVRSVHQVCRFHVRCWVGRALRELESKLLEEWLWLLEKIKVIMEELPPDGGKQLLDLYKQLPGHLKREQERTAVDKLRHLLIRLSESWERYTTFFHDPGIPWINNRIEQAIGRMKMRAKTVRGYKTQSGMLNGLLVSSTRLN